MYLIADIKEKHRAQKSSLPVADDRLEIDILRTGQEAEAFDFLSARPLHSFGLVGYLSDNGSESARNRGHFVVCRDREGRIEGLALIGHAVLFEARNDTAIEALAKLTRANIDSSIVLGEEQMMSRFCYHYSMLGRRPVLMTREKLFQIRWPVSVFEDVPGLRLATLRDFHQVVRAHSQMGIEERGSNPLEEDRAGFVDRCRWRIENHRTWVLIEGDRLLFKAEVMFDMPRLAYIEGVWVPPEFRSKGHGVRCLSQLCRTLLRRSESVCLLADDHRSEIHSFYNKVGFRQAGSYQALYL